MTIDEKIEDSAQAIFKEVMDKRAEILEEFARAYTAETGLKPSEIVLCHTLASLKLMASTSPLAISS